MARVATAALNRKILEKAGELFQKQGYTATTIKQIATASGCTNAALYYHFSGGKEHILREVIRGMVGENIDFVAAEIPATTLEELLHGLSKRIGVVLPRIASRINWLLLEFPSLPEAEQTFLRQRLQQIHDIFQNHIRRFVPDETTADRLAWVVYSAFIGYQQIFGNMDMQHTVDFPREDYGAFLASVLKPDSAMID